MKWLEQWRDAARECGYALAEHGSKIKDFDLIAVPWIEQTTSMDQLVKRLCDTDPDKFFVVANDPKVPKPHGRFAYTIYVAGGTYIDLSIMPTL